MNDTSKNLRSRAATELRKSRNGGSADSKADNMKRAAAYKSLSENEEWLAGEQPRHPKHEPETPPGGNLGGGREGGR